jgi:hypothetical protein
MPIVHRSTSANRTRVIVSLCDYSGAWCSPYAEAGYTVVQFDLKHGDDVTDQGNTLHAILEVLHGASVGTTEPARVVGVLAAPPCTDFASSGARWWSAKDADGTTTQSVRIVEACLDIIEACSPDWWALENPVGRLPKLVSGIGDPWYFNPCDYAGWLVGEAADRDRYTKRTGIWGTASKPPCRPLDPVMYETTRKDGRVVRGSWQWATLGGKSERTKTLRSNTPEGFARAFALVNR